MIGTEQFDRFISEHRWAVVTTLRRDGSPSSSMNAYARDGDQLVISTQGHRLKTRTLEHDPRIVVCVINNHEPFNYVSVEGECEVQREGILEATRLVFKSLSAVGYPEPPDIEKWMREQGRVILRVTARHVHGVIRG
jgi:PPOX class probable F420-dependent enzyme